MSSSVHDSQQLHLLIERANAGDSDAHQRLLEGINERLLKMARMMLRNYPHLRRWEETDDVVQNAMLRLHRSFAEVKPGSVRAFLGLAATQVRRALVDLIRHHFGPQGHGANYESDVAGNAEEGSAGALGAEPDRGEKPETLQAWAAFHEAAERLPPEEREVFDLTWYAGLQQMDIAAELGVSLPTVQRRWQRARVLLHTALHGESPDP